MLWSKISNQLKYLFFIFIALFAYLPTAHGYLSIDEHIEHFVSNITINGNGTIDVQEKISYDFGPNQRHGIYRTIPLLKTNADDKTFKLTIVDLDVSGDPFTKSINQGLLKIKIGDPNKTVSGKKEYTINYRVLGALTYFSDHDELYWNITGNDWEVPIAAVDGTVKFENTNQFPNVQLACYSGTKGSTDKSCSIQTTNTNSIIYSNIEPLQLNDGLTIVTGFPKGLVSVLEPKPYYDDILFGFLIKFLSFIAYMIVFWVLYKWLKEWLNTSKKQKIVAAWFSPPKTEKGEFLSPAETAGLVYKSVNQRALTATIIHLAQRGFLKINGEDKNNVKLIRRKDWATDTSVNNFEKMLLDNLFLNSEKAEVSIKELKKSYKFPTALPKIYNDMLDNLYRDKLFVYKPSSYKILMGIILVVALILAFPFYYGLPFAILAFIFRNASLAKTDLGIEKYSEAKSLFNFLKSQEEQLDFQADKQMFFEKLLPYATAFGVEKIWANRFKDIDLTKSDWYQGSSNNSLAYIPSLNSLNRGFGSMSASRSSSGFSSGFSGGSSGGGGGGGGGGSW